MRKQKIPGSDLETSPICLGAGGFGTATPKEESWRILDAFAERGGNFVDSAHIYAAWVPNGVGASERTLGEWMAANGMRDAMVVGTKGGHPDLKTMDRPRLTPAEIEKDLAESLDRLQTNVIDLYWLHRDDPVIPVGELLGVLGDHLASGRIRAIGASNWSPGRLRQAARYAQDKGVVGFCASQIGWSLAQANIDALGLPGLWYMDDETMAFHRESGLAVVAYSSQARGFFSGKYAVGVEPATKKGKGLARLYFSEENFGRLDRAGRLAKRYDCEPNEIALAYLMSQPFPVHPIVGPTSVEQIEASCRAGDLRLSSAEVALLEDGGSS